MTPKRILAACLVGSALLTATPVASAFDSSAPAPADHLLPEQAAAFSKEVEKALAERGARVALVFRAGRPRDQLPDGINYTHGAFWVFQPVDTPDRGRINGYVAYNLFHGDGEDLPRTQSYLATDFPFDFVSASRVDDVAIIIPTPEMQRRILAIMASPDYEALHVEAYSLISNAGDPQFQNCNEFMLDVIAAAAWQTRDYAQLKANLKAHFAGSTIEAGPLMRIFGPMADERLRMDDQSGVIRTVTFESLAEFMLRHGYASEAFVLTRSGA